MNTREFIYYSGLLTKFATHWPVFCLQILLRAHLAYAVLETGNVIFIRKFEVKVLVTFNIYLIMLKLITFNIYFGLLTWSFILLKKSVAIMSWKSCAKI